MKQPRENIAPKSDEVVSLEDVTVNWGDKTLLSASLTVRRGERIIVRGASGAGKTTLLRVMAGIETPATGTVRLFGQPLNDETHNSLLARTGLSFQRPHLDTGMNVTNNLLDLSVLTGRTTRRNLKESLERAQTLADELGIADKVGQLAGSLSGGEAQLVALGRLLVPRPELILLDEPSSAMDTGTRQSALGIIADIAGREQITVIEVTHNEDGGDLTGATRQITMSDGAIISDTPYSQTGVAKL